MTVDTLKLAQKLEAAGFSAEQARGASAAINEELKDGVATKADLTALELRLYKAMIVQAVAIAGLVAAFLKLFL